MDNEDKIEFLEKKLEKMKETHKAAWDMYDPELYTYHMIRQEEKLEEEIKKLKDEN